MSNEQTLEFRKLIVTDSACFYGHTFIGDPSRKTCGDLQIQSDVSFVDRSLRANSIQSRGSSNGIEIVGIEMREDGGMDMNCGHIMDAGVSNLSSISAKDDQVINVGDDFNVLDTPEGGKITWDCGVEIGNSNTTANNCTSISVGQDTRSGNSSISLGNNSGNSTGTENISVGDNSGNLTTGNKNINIGPGSTTFTSVDQTIAVGCDAFAAHEGAIVLGPGASCEPNMLSLNFPDGNTGITLGSPPGTIPAYLTICVNGTPYQINGFVDECYEPVLTPFSQTVLVPGGYQGQNSADDNKQAYVEYFDKFTGEPALTGGFIVQYDAPGETDSGNYNYVDGLRILDFNDGSTMITPTMYDIQYNLYTSLNTNLDPPPECLPDGWLVRTTPILRWTDAANVQLVNFGTSAQVTWDSIPLVLEYAVSVTVNGTAYNYANTEVPMVHYYGTLVASGTTTVTLDISQTGNAGSYWETVTSITARVVGYEECDKSPSPSDHCAPANAAPVVNAGTDFTSPTQTSIALSGSVTDDNLFNPTTTNQWTKISGPGTAVFGDDTLPSTTVTVDMDGTYVFQLEANDGIEQVSDTVTIEVTNIFIPPTNRVSYGQCINGPGAWDNTGQSVALSSNGLRMIVGSPLGGGHPAGSGGFVRMYNYNGSSWSTIGYISVGSSGSFGYNVDISGDGNRVIIGYPGYGGGFGRTYVWQYNNPGWTQMGSPITGISSVGFEGGGVGLNVDGSVMVTGAEQTFSNRGMARVYDWSGSNWVQRGATLLGNSTGDRIGRSASLSADGNTVLTSGSQATIVWDWNGSSWVQRGTIPRRGSSSDITPDGNTVIAGPWASSGNVGVFEWNGSAWVQKGSDIFSPEGGYTLYFGYEVRIANNGDSVAITNAFQNIATGLQEGAAYLFDWNGTSWVHRGNPIRGTYTASLRRVAMNSLSTIVATGAPNADAVGTNSGTVCSYRYV